MGGHWATFFGDARKALGVWQRYPALPAISLGLSLLGWLLRYVPFGTPIGIAILVLQGGWFGTERMWYLRAFRGKGLTAAEALRFTRAFIGRFFLLGFVVFIPMMIAVLVVSYLIPDGRLGPWVLSFILPFAILMLIVDVFLTFVTPALTYTTKVVGEAIGIGGRMLRQGWPATAWYALFPPMAIVALTYIRPGGNAFGWLLIASSCSATLLNLLAKGATAAFYLRHSEVGDDGAAFTDYLSPKKEKEPAEAGS